MISYTLLFVHLYCARIKCKGRQNTSWRLSRNIYCLSKKRLRQEDRKGRLIGDACMYRVEF